MRIPLPFLIPVLCAVMAGCSAQGEKVVKELEDMPGLTCVTNAAGHTTCGPDTVQAAEESLKDD